MGVIKPNAVRAADIIVDSSNSKASASIKAALGSDIAHAALCTQPGRLIEALDDGSTEHPFRPAFVINKDTKVNLAIVLRYRNITPQQQNDVVSSARSLLYRPYDLTGAVGSGMSNNRGRIGTTVGCIISPVACSIEQMEINNNASEENRDKAFFCSELVARSFELAGIPLTFDGKEKAATWVNPRMVRMSTSLLYVGNLDLSEYS